MNEDHILGRLAASLTIAHHIPGRVRFKLAIDLSAVDRDAAAGVRRFVEMLNGAPAIRSVKLNPLARSCVVEYDSKAIAPAAWQDVLNGSDTPEADMLLQLFRAAGRAAGVA